MMFVVKICELVQHEDPAIQSAAKKWRAEIKAKEPAFKLGLHQDNDADDDESSAGEEDEVDEEDEEENELEESGEEQ